jgi:hypothetical protein
MGGNMFVRNLGQRRGVFQNAQTKNPIFGMKSPFVGS